MIPEKILFIKEQTKVIFMNKEINFYCKSDADVSGFMISLFFSFLVWALSHITGNFSWVDRLWSILPTMYTYHFLFYDNICSGNALSLNSRQLIISILCTLWSIRLSYNFFRKGGYNPGGEDYRWQIVKKNINNAFLFELLNIVFISLIQNILLFLIATPASLANKNKTLNTFDYSLILIFIILLLLETISDQQQWNFQEKKKVLIKENAELTGDFKRGFLTKGLFRYSRHPNFFAEMSIWWVVYLFSVSATGDYLNWTFLGAFFLTLLFQASTKLTEDISSSKHPGYKDYQKTTSRFIPLWSGINEFEEHKTK